MEDLRKYILGGSEQGKYIKFFLAGTMERGAG
jgi:hypothetical protein